MISDPLDHHELNINLGITKLFSMNTLHQDENI